MFFSLHNISAITQPADGDSVTYKYILEELTD